MGGKLLPLCREGRGAGGGGQVLRPAEIFFKGILTLAQVASLFQSHSLLNCSIRQTRQWKNKCELSTINFQRKLQKCVHQMRYPNIDIVNVVFVICFKNQGFLLLSVLKVLNS